jgi:predicted short-subunit dehydrogenase-like oxidoreductase (DUF2520 family)
MTRRKTDDEQAVTPPADGLEAVVREWLYFLVEHMPTMALEMVVRELRAAGIDTPSALAGAPIPLVAAAIRTAWQTDAHSLTGLAARYQQGVVHGNPEP